MGYKNPEVQAKKHREYYLAHLEQIRAWRRTPEAIAMRNKVVAKARPQRLRYMRKYYLAAKKRLKDYLAAHPCIDCGFSDVRALQFDHVRGVKEFDVSIATVRWDKIEKEIAKCDVRCANCHKIRHYGEL